MGVPVHFIYGQNDWMEKERSKDLIISGQIHGSFNLVPNCGHAPHFTNPKDSKILIDKL